MFKIHYDLIGPYIYKLPNIKWMQGTWTSIDQLLIHLQPNNPPTFTITRFTGKHFGRLMNEYVIANIINFERAFYQIADNQKLHDWNKDARIYVHRTLNELTIGALRLGSIGSISMFKKDFTVLILNLEFVVGERLHFVGAEIIGYGRKPDIERIINTFLNTTVRLICQNF